MGADSVDLTVVEDDYSVGVLNRGDTLSDDQLGCIGNFFTESFSYHCVCLCVNGAGGVVENKNFRLFEQGSCNAKSLLLSAGDICAAALDIGVVLVGHLLNKFIRLSELADSDYILVGCVFIAPAKIFFYRS